MIRMTGLAHIILPLRRLAWAQPVNVSWQYSVRYGARTSAPITLACFVLCTVMSYS